MTFKVSLDSSIIISHLIGDIHKDDVLEAVEQLYFSGRLLTTNPRDFLHSFPNLEVLTPRGFLEKYV